MTRNGRTKRKRKVIAFFLRGKELCWISFKGLFPGEIQETKGLLAFENKVNESEIKAIYREV